MKKYVFSIVYLISLTPNSHAQEKVILSERLMKSIIEKSVPSVEQIEASFLSVKNELLAKKDAFSFRLEGESQVAKSEERLLAQFDGGVTNRLNTYSVGIVKPTRYGVDLGVKSFGNKVTNAFIADAATTGTTFSLSIDLFKNFLGRKTSNDIKQSQMALERAELEKNISLKTFEANIRKLYWALVANNEQKIALTALVELAEQQYQEAVRRSKSGVADAGEVARYHSQWTTRKASLLSLRYRRGGILRSIKELLPELNGKEIELGPYSVDATVQSVLACSAYIRSFPRAPFQFTHYDEIVDLLNREENYAQQVIRTYDDPQVQLVGEYSDVGRDYGFSDARQNLSDDGRARQSVALKVSIPFGGKKSDTREVSEVLAKKRYHAQAQGNLSKITAFHSETADIISILKDVVKNQKEANESLAKSLKVSRKKYKQARISVQELISEQDSLLQSKINEIETNLTIINTLMDYFSIYTDIPCALNRI